MTEYRPSPQSKANELIDRLSRALTDGVNELTVRRLEQDARQLMSADVVGAHTVLGGVAALRWGPEAVHHHYRIALQHFATAEMYFNYAVSLDNVEEGEAAFEAGNEAQRRAPGDRFLGGYAAGLAWQAGHFATGLRLCEKWNALVPAEKHALTRILARLDAAVEEGRFSERAVRRVLATMRTVQKRERVRGVASATMEDPRDSGTFLYEQHVQISPSEASGLNEQFVDQVVAKPEFMDDPGFRFVAVFVGVGK